MDLSEGVLDVARRRAAEAGLANYAFIRASALALPFGPDEFDAVVSNMVLQLIPDQRKALAEVERVLKPGGRAVLQLQGGGKVAQEWMQVFRRAWREVLPEREPPSLCHEITVEDAAAHLVGLGIEDFDISWRHRVRWVAPADVPRFLEFIRLVTGFWQCGVEEPAARRIDALVTQGVKEAAEAAGFFTNTVNVLTLEFAKPRP